MILTIYAILLAFSIIIIALGFWINNPTLEIIGFFFMFCLGLVLMSGTIEYKTGVYNDQVHIYGNSLFYENGTSRYHWEYIEQSLQPSQTKEEIRLFHIRENTINIYSNFDADNSGEILGLFSLNNLFGVLMSILGGFGMAITFFNMRMRDD